MDKKKETFFNLNNFLLALSTPLDFVAKEKFGIKLHNSKRVAYVAVKLAKEFNFEPKFLSDLCSFCLLQNIALPKLNNIDKEYCNVIQKYSEAFPFLEEHEEVLKYHGENYDGSGIFGLKGEDIPLFSQFISFANMLDKKFDLSKKDIHNRVLILEFVKENENKLFSHDIAECFIEFSQVESFWLDLQNIQEMLTGIFSTFLDYTEHISFEKLLELCKIYYNLVEEGKPLIENCDKVTEFYGFEHKDKLTFQIAAALSNIGKLSIPKTVLHKEDKLTHEEFALIKSYPYITKQTLTHILGFNDIISWASSIQEFLNKEGYPFGLEGKDLSFKHRLLCVTNIYSSLMYKTKFREAYSKEKAYEILKDFANKEQIDKSIVNDFKTIFKI